MSNIDALNYHDIFLLNDDHEKDKSLLLKGKESGHHQYLKLLIFLDFIKITGF